MTQLRRNHSPQKGGTHLVLRMLLFVVLLVIGLMAAFRFFNIALPDFNTLDNESTFLDEPRTWLPNTNGQLIHHTHFSLSYIEKYEQAEWTAYRLTKSMLTERKMFRNGIFVNDKKVKTGSAQSDDYNRSGFQRGHLVPAADMAFDSIAMMESFYMSNISPQLKSFNNGIWRELEINIRDWCYRYDTLYVITGPVYSNQVVKSIGKQKVRVPDSFFKVVLHFSGDNSKAVGFIIPNALSEYHLSTYMMPVDSVEKVTDLDFFNELIDDIQEEKIESTFEKEFWPINEKRFRQRMEQWNHE